MDKITSKKKCHYEVVLLAPPVISRSICIFACFSLNSRIDKSTIHYLKKLKELNYEIMLVTTSKLIENCDLKILEEICFGIIKRENVTLDFGSWQVGLQTLRNNDIPIPSLLLANDSVLGPFFEIKVPPQNLNQIFGITESWEVIPHLQSYFLYFPEIVIKSKFFEDFWFIKFRFVRKKRSVIDLYELGLTGLAKKAGIQIKALIPYEEILSNHLKSISKKESLELPNVKLALNPTLYLWKTALEDLKMPFIKKELLRNLAMFPATLSELSKIENDIKTSYNQELFALIKRDQN
jgi:lipopolysaccharide biosynthesis protein